MKLSKFLKKRGCYKKFVKNFDIEFNEDWKDDYDYSVAWAFNWEYSPEGFKYWDDVNNEWYVIKNKEYNMLWLLEKEWRKDASTLDFPVLFKNKDGILKVKNKFTKQKHFNKMYRNGWVLATNNEIQLLNKKSK